MSGAALRRAPRAAARRMLALPGVLPRYLEATRRFRADAVLILAYHGVTAQALAVPNACQLALGAFERQMDLLRTQYRVLPLAEVAERLAAGRPLPPHTAVLTFDDGFRNVATTAFPVLERHQLPATVFLVTGLVGTRQPAWPDRLYFSVTQTTRDVLHFDGAAYPLRDGAERKAAYRALSNKLKTLVRAEREARLTQLAEALEAPEVPADHPVASLSWDEVEALARTGLVAFGSHTHTHPILSRCAPEEQRRELEASRDALRARGLAADLFAYPNGRAADFTAQTQALLRELGYRCAVSMLPGLNRPGADLFALRRIGVGEGLSSRQFALQITGL